MGLRPPPAFTGKPVATSLRYLELGWRFSWHDRNRGSASDDDAIRCLGGLTELRTLKLLDSDIDQHVFERLCTTILQCCSLTDLELHVDTEASYTSSIRWQPDASPLGAAVFAPALQRFVWLTNQHVHFRRDFFPPLPQLRTLFWGQTKPHQWSTEERNKLRAGSPLIALLNSQPFPKPPQGEISE